MPSEQAKAAAKSSVGGCIVGDIELREQDYANGYAAGYAAHAAKTANLFGLALRLAEAERKLAAMTTALKPFAAYGNQIDANWSSKVIPDTAPICYSPEKVRNDCPTIGDCRIAARALEAEPPGAAERT